MERTKTAGRQECLQCRGLKTINVSADYEKGAILSKGRWSKKLQAYIDDQ